MNKLLQINILQENCVFYVPRVLKKTSTILYYFFRYLVMNLFNIIYVELNSDCV
jgi:hypothetical protein